MQHVSVNKIKEGIQASEQNAFGQKLLVSPIDIFQYRLDMGEKGFQIKLKMLNQFICNKNRPKIRFN